MATDGQESAKLPRSRDPRHEAAYGNADPNRYRETQAHLSTYPALPKAELSETHVEQLLDVDLAPQD
ncbi:hypothetical protein CTA1_7254 [Colletotrichum tanaceti]|uniref:Uncharacterized protein n=1 Tax=Colletotrichum tanaceti TaxID=1306861 RepID=A0A4V6Y9D7_9PEZI|nr:hypothetical protein CTA1_7254 [Colletotrichum tanaceti]